MPAKHAKKNGVRSAIRRAAHATRRVVGVAQGARSGYTAGYKARGAGNTKRAEQSSAARERRDDLAREKRGAREQRDEAARTAREQKQRAADERKAEKEREREKAAHRRRLLQEQSHRKREQKITAQEREDMISSRRPPTPRARRKPTLNLSSLDEAKAMFGDYEENPASLFCSDCDKEFTPGDIRHTMRDGRTICAKCAKAAKTKAAKKAQPALFGQMEGSQNTLFNPSCSCKSKRNPACDAHSYEVNEYTVKGHCRGKRGTGSPPKAKPTAKAKSTRAKAARAKGANDPYAGITQSTKRVQKKPYEDLTLSQYVRRRGGVRPARDGNDAGELRRLSNKESGTSGLVNKNSTYTLEQMMDEVNAEGYRDPYDNSEFELGSFASAVSDDAQGYVKISHPGKEWDYSRRNPMLATLGALSLIPSGVLGAMELHKRLTKPTQKKKRNPASRERLAAWFKKFRGFHPENERRIAKSRLVPHGTWEIGELPYLDLKGGRRQAFPAGSKLVGDAKGDLHIVKVNRDGSTRAPFKAPPRTNPAQSVTWIDEVKNFPYRSKILHIGGDTIYLWIHKAGEEGGARPVFGIDDEGYPLLRGGTCELRESALVN